MPTTISFCGQPVTHAEMGLIRDIIHDFPSLSLAELSKTICELLEWRRISSLPELRVPTCQGPRKINLDASSEPEAAVEQSLDDCLPLALDLIADCDARNLFRQYIQRYHYLGYKVPCGAQLRYFVRSRPLSNRIVACLLFTSAALKIAPRDRWIGWSDQARKCNLPRIVSNSRFLILPWIQVPHLASKILSLAAHQLPDDWLDAYCVRPLLLESFVDPERFSGTCYRAANWIHVGATQGRGRMDLFRSIHVRAKFCASAPNHTLA